MPILNSRQDWTPGATVRLGFLRLVVESLIPTPGDWRPDTYVLTDPRHPDRIYHFTPHHGIERIK